MKASLLPAFAIACLSGGPPAVAADPVPTESFFRTPQYSDMRMSPSGRFVTVIYTVDGTTNAAVIDLTTMKAAAVTGYKDPARVDSVVWKSDNRLIYGVMQPDNYHVLNWTMGAVDRDGKNHLLISDPREAGDRYGYEYVVDYKINDPDKVLLSSDKESLNNPAIYDTDIATLWAPMRMEHNTGNTVFTTPRTKVTTAPGRACDYLVDNDGTLRVCLTHEEDLSERLLYRADAKTDWRVLGKFSEDTGYIHPVGFSPDNQTLYVLSNFNRDTRALYEFDLRTRELGKLLFEAPGVDLDDEVVKAVDGRRLLGVTYSTERRHVFYLDAETARLQAELQQVFPEYSVAIASRSSDGLHAVIFVSNDKTPGRYYLYDGASHKVSFFTDRAAWVDPKLMAPIKAVKFKSRDGLELSGYLTLPPGRDPKNLPLIVYPHGGPFGIRSVAGWDADTQFLASRGYAVLEINFRGSGGYGAKFKEAGYQEWGGKMQDDITDGVLWSVEQGIVDKGRVCIYGASYGGYAAMMGLIQTPDLYRCGITYAGVSDLETIYQKVIFGNSLYRVRSRDEINFWSRVLGHHSDAAFLRERSPLHNVDKIRAPVFIAHGQDDFIVPISDATRLRDALASQHKTVEYLTKVNEWHGFQKESNTIDLYNHIEAFLRKYNPAY